MMTRKNILNWMAVMLAVSVFAGAVALAADAEKPKQKPKAKSNMMKLQGKVETTKDANDAIVSVKLTVGSDVYNVVMNDKGKKLGKEFNGKEASVHGMVSEKNGQKQISVYNFKEPPKAKEPNTPKK